jgi:hypothetical protein
MRSNVEGLYKHWSQVPEWIWDLTPNFHPRSDKKLASPDTGAIRIDIASLVCLQRLRDVVGPLVVISGYRSPLHNAYVGGEPNSQHKVHIAFDLSTYGKDYLTVVTAAKAAGFTGIGLYPSRNFIHVDRGPVRFWFGNQNDKQWYAQVSQDIDVKLA